ncbi:hypothetical protein Tco_1110269 [Tanacetum coccineum]|uniref:Uncharacterized protein n=2 Tax=Tanacetum coccineum TaxID=301880 RepID=A0ABQ5IJI0_9ASTR
MHGPYVRRMIPEPGDPDREVPVAETFHEQTDEELTEKEVKQMEADDQAIQIILMGLPEYIYAVVDSCETAQEIWLRVQQMMKGSDIWIQDKKAKLFNEWERFTSTDGESIESYYRRFSKLMNDFKRNKHFSEKIASNLKAHDPLALMANSNNPDNYLVFHQDQPSSVTYMQQPQPNNNFNPQPSFNTNYMQQPMPNPEDITDPTTTMNMTLVLMAKAFKLYYSTPTNNNQIISSNPRNRQIAHPGMNLGQDRQMQMVEGNRGNQFRQYAGQNVGNQNGYNAVQTVGNQVVQNSVQNLGIQNAGNQNGLIVIPGIGNMNLNPNRNGNVVETRAEATARDLEEIEEVNANYILIANLQQASTSSTQIDSAPIYDSDGSAEVHEYDNCYNNEIFNMFTQEEQYTKLLDPIPEPHQVHQNDSNVISVISTIEVEKVNTVNRKMKETNADLTTELARYKNQEKCFEINQEKYDKLKRCYQKSVYQEQCLTKKINALYLSSAKMITTLNEEIAVWPKESGIEDFFIAVILSYRDSTMGRIVASHEDSRASLPETQQHVEKMNFQKPKSHPETLSIVFFSTLSWKIAIHTSAWNVPGALQRPQGACGGNTLDNGEFLSMGSLCGTAKHLYESGLSPGHSYLLAMMTGNLFVTLQKCYSRWGGEHIREAQLRSGRFRNIPMNFKAKSMTTGSSTGLSEVGRLVIFLGSTVSFVTSGFNFPPTSRTITYEWAPTQVTQLCSTTFTGRGGAGTEITGLSRSRALNHIFHSSNIGDTRSGSARTSLYNNGFASELRTLDMLSMMLEQSAGLLSKKLPPAAEFKENIQLLQRIPSVELEQFCHSFDYQPSYLWEVQQDSEELVVVDDVPKTDDLR